ncbi:MAG: hypothetical protein AB7S38_11755 [Vulcanimicrobiota bacterium]
MAKMAMADGILAREEREFLAPMLGGMEGLEEALKIARKTPLKDLVAPITNYADRFFIALRAASMAHIDTDFDAREEALYAELLELLGLEKPDMALIDQSVKELFDIEPKEPDPRIIELFSQSSFT